MLSKKYIEETKNKLKECTLQKLQDLQHDLKLQEFQMLTFAKQNIADRYFKACELCEEELKRRINND